MRPVTQPEKIIERINRVSKKKVRVAKKVALQALRDAKHHTRSVYNEIKDVVENEKH